MSTDTLHTRQCAFRFVGCAGEESQQAKSNEQKKKDLDKNGRSDRRAPQNLHRTMRLGARVAGKMPVETGPWRTVPCDV